SRWGIDEDEDGDIDRWKRLSAEEATRVAIQAMVRSDFELFQTVLITKEDLLRLGIRQSAADSILEAVKDSEKKLRAILSQSRLITSQTKWMRFDCTMPGLIPADAGKAKQDLLVYENAMAIVETGGKTGLVQFGEMLQVGDVWKLTQMPKPLEGNAVQVVVAGPLMRPAASGVISPAASELSPEMQRLLDQLQALDRKPPAPSADRATVARYVSQRTALLSQLVSVSQTPQQREQWLRQLVDSLASAAQTGAIRDGVQRLAALEEDLRRRSPKSRLLPYVSYRRLMADYTVRIQQADPKQQAEIQKKWLEELTAFAERYPDAEDAADAMLQLAVHYEFSGQADEARQWYQRVADRGKQTTAAIRAAGALRRLDLAGKPLQLAGPGLTGGTIDIQQFRGRTVLVFFWATWCTPCTQSLPQLRALYAQYHDRGFEIIGINLDTTADPVKPFLSQQRVPWPQIYQPGGLNSPIAQSFGIVSLPTLFLVDSSGRVLSTNISIEELKTRLAEVFKK
ncbi:MAG: redoxin family protein, partial [Planctomycetes bacterium]|nr:redoxin family protein [Planctomycetota bacterium]